MEMEQEMEMEEEVAMEQEMEEHEELLDEVVEDEEDAGEEVGHVVESIEKNGRNLQEIVKFIKERDGVWRDKTRINVDHVTIYFSCNKKKVSRYTKCHYSGKLVYYHHEDQCLYAKFHDHTHQLKEGCNPTITTEVRRAVEVLVDLNYRPKAMVRELANRHLGNYSAQQLTDLKRRIKNERSRAALIASGIDPADVIGFSGQVGTV